MNLFGVLTWTLNTDASFKMARLARFPGWPLMQTMISFAFSWNLGILEGGRRVNAGWKKSSRLAQARQCHESDSQPAFQ